MFKKIKNIFTDGQFHWFNYLNECKLTPKRIHESPKKKKPIRLTLVIWIPFETDKTVLFHHFILYFSRLRFGIISKLASNVTPLVTTPIFSVDLFIFLVFKRHRIYNRTLTVMHLSFVFLFRT